MTALHIMATLRATSPRLAFLAREWALGLGQAAFIPDTYDDVPVVAIGTADRLSRRFYPARASVGWPPPMVARLPPTSV